LPSYLRFVKGVVDCEDLPLNISRETYQDSALISKLRNVITRRVLKMLEDEIKRDADRYDNWFDTFNHFLKEGLMMDSENKESLLRLMRYSATFKEKGLISLDDYVKKMKAGQQKIYYVTAQTRDGALNNPFMEPFKNAEDAPPVLILTNNVDEVCFN
jgi:HSP90 family molecular chaperone